MPLPLSNGTPAPSRHQLWRYLFQAGWLLIIAALALGNPAPSVWTGLLVAGLVSALLVKRAACSCGCPIFPLGELLWRGGEKLCGRTFALPFWFDLVLRSAKYLVLGWILVAFYQGQVPEIAGAQHAAPLLATLLIFSLVLQMPWCRYLCPYGALVGLVSMASLLKIRRSPNHCVRCHKCSNRCPANLPVMLLTTIRSPECFTCYRCVDGCPAPAALALAAPGNRPVPAWLMGVVVSGVIVVVIMAGIFR